MVESSRGGPILEFGLRRAQGPRRDRGYAASHDRRRQLSAPMWAHPICWAKRPRAPTPTAWSSCSWPWGWASWARFEPMPNSTPTTVCCWSTRWIRCRERRAQRHQGLRRAAAQGHKPVGIRLDSGDQAYLAIQAAAEMLNEAGFPDASIVLSSDLDELVIWQIITQIVHEAPRYGLDPEQVIERLVYGVGTRLITSWGDPALGGVYKLVAIQPTTERVATGIGHQDLRDAGQDAQPRPQRDSGGSMGGGARPRRTCWRGWMKSRAKWMR